MRRTLRNKFLSVLALGIVLLCTLAFTPLSFFHFEKEDKTLGMVKRGDLSQVVTVAGMVMPARKTLFSPTVNSYVKKIYVHIGENVKEGQPVVSFVQSLRDVGEPVYPLRAPFAGEVVQIPRFEGEFVDLTKDNNFVVRIDDLSHLTVGCEVPESDINKMKIGQEALVKSNGVLNREYHAKVMSIALAAKDKERWTRSGDRVDFDVFLTITDKDERIRPGMSAILDIVTDQRKNVLTLPHEYVESSGVDYWVTQETGLRKKVEVGTQNDQLVEIRSGLNENDKVKMVDFFSLPPQE